MWRILVSLVTVVSGAIVARIYARPALPARRARRVEGPDGVAGNGRIPAPDGAARDGTAAVVKPGEPSRQGWTRPRPATIPRPAYWPMVAALGVTFIFWGMVTTVFFGALGIILLIIAASGWIWELVHESE